MKFGPNMLSRVGQFLYKLMFITYFNCSFLHFIVAAENTCLNKDISISVI